MLKLIIRQANWAIMGSFFGFLVGFFLKIYLIDIVGVYVWGKYISAHLFATTISTLLSVGIPLVVMKFIPTYIKIDRDNANLLISKILRYLFGVSFLFILFMLFSSSFLDRIVYSNIDNFSLILLLCSIHVPIALFTEFIVSLYRSVFKIKEVIIVGNFLSVPIRAIFTLLIFQYTQNILYFIAIEIFTSSLSLFVLFYLFNKNEINLFPKISKSIFLQKNVINYGKKVYFNSIVTLLSNKSLVLIISIMLTPDNLGIFSILLTITGVCMFIHKNINKIFAPVISKLFNDNNINELDVLYKRITFILNFFSIPLSIIIMCFAKDILLLYDSDGEIVAYASCLYVIMGARIISLLAGSSGTMMLMAGLEKKELVIQIIKAIFIIVLFIVFLKDYTLFTVVILFSLFLLFVNFSELFFISRHLKISPFSRDLITLIIVSIPLIYFSITHQFIFTTYHYFIIPITIYLIYILMFYKQINTFIREVMFDK